MQTAWKMPHLHEKETEAGETLLIQDVCKDISIIHDFGYTINICTFNIAIASNKYLFSQLQMFDSDELKSQTKAKRNQNTELLDLKTQRNEIKTYQCRGLLTPQYFYTGITPVTVRLAFKPGQE